MEAFRLEFESPGEEMVLGANAPIGGSDEVEGGSRIVLIGAEVDARDDVVGIFREDGPRGVAIAAEVNATGCSDGPCATEPLLSKMDEK